MSHHFISTTNNNTQAHRIRGMWRAVIMQALIDAASNSKKQSSISQKQKAIEWLLNDNEDFIEVCILADMDPIYVQRKAKTALQRGCKWRNDLRKAEPVAYLYAIQNDTKSNGLFPNKSKIRIVTQKHHKDFRVNLEKFSISL